MNREIISFLKYTWDSVAIVSYYPPMSIHYLPLGLVMNFITSPLGYELLIWYVLFFSTFYTMPVFP